MMRQLIVLLLVFILIGGLVIIGIWTQIIPEYRATGEVRVRSIIPHLVFQTEDSGVIPLYESYKKTQVSVMRSKVVLERVLAQKEVQDTQWYKEPPRSLIQRLSGKPPISPLERLRNDLIIQPCNQTEIIDVIFTYRNINDAKIIVNTVLDQYIKYVNEDNDITKDNIYSKLIEQYNKLETEIQGREQIIAKLYKDLGTNSPEELISTVRVRLENTQAHIRELHDEIEVLHWELKQSKDNNSNDSSGTPAKPSIINAASASITEKQPKYHEDSEWRALDRNVRTIQHGITSSVEEPNSPKITRAQKDLEFAKELLRLRETQLDEQWLDQLKSLKSKVDDDVKEDSESLEYKLSRAMQEEKLLVESYKEQEKEFEKLFQNAQLLDKEKISLQHKRELFRAVQQRLDAKNMERHLPDRIEVLMKAFASGEPHKDRRIMYTVIVLVVGCLGFGLCVWYLKRELLL